MRRIFIAINLPEEIKKKISQIVAELSEDANKYFKPGEMRFLPPENWHLTISFLGGQSDEALDGIIVSMKEIVADFSLPEIEFENVILAPPNKTPRMIWLLGTERTSKSLGQLKDRLEDLLIENGVRFKSEARKYSAHITLAKFSLLNEDKLENIKNYLCKPESSQRISALRFEAKSLDLMESDINRSGAEYIVLSKIVF